MENAVTVTNQQETAISPISDNTLLALAENAEKRVDALNKIKRAALKATNPRDWTDQNGNPYLQVSGSEKVGRVFGISWRIDEPVLEREEGGHFSYTYKGIFALAGAEIDAIGTRSSKDGFFKKYDYSKKDEDGNSIKTELPPSEIDKGDVKKAAYTNCIGNGVTRILGLRNLTWEDLHEFANINREQVTGKVDYKKSGKQQDGIKSEGALTATVAVSDVRVSEYTKRDKTKGEKFTIKSGDDSYNTFSKSFATVAKDARGEGLKVEITYTENSYGKNIEAIKKTETPVDRIPGEEG